MDAIEKWTEVLRASTQQIHNFLYPSMVGIVIVKEDKPRSVGSGTCLKLNGARYIATAAHVIDDSHGDEIRIVAGPSNPTGIVPFVRILRGGGGLDDNTDLALLELSEATAEATGKTFLDDAWLDPNAGPAYDRFTLVAGYPTEMLDITRLDERELVVKCMAMGTTSLDFDSWPVSARPEYDIVYDYPRENGRLIPDVPVARWPAAHGMSGGGIWATNIERDSGVWHVGKVRLIGIIRSWHRGEEWARATQLSHLLRLASSK